MAGRLQDRVALVTCGGTGIGEAIAHKFAREGARVVVAGLPGDPVQEVAGAIKAAARACVQMAIDSFGRLDVLVNNAGVFLATGETQDYPVDRFDETLRMNVRSCFLMTRAALPHLQRTRGNVVSAGSEAGWVGIAQNTMYGGTKAFIHAFTKGVAAEQAQYGVRANCVCPGPIDTAWTHKETGPMDAQMEKLIVQATPLGRRGTVEEVANVHAFLASDEASFVTGALYFVDGGITISKGPVGDQVAKDLRKEPQAGLPVEHTRDGNRNKVTETVK